SRRRLCRYVEGDAGAARKRVYGRRDLRPSAEYGWRTAFGRSVRAGLHARIDSSCGRDAVGRGQMIFHQRAPGLESGADVWHRLNVVAEKAELAAQRMDVAPERLNGDAVAGRADGLGDADARERLVRPGGEEF